MVCANNVKYMAMYSDSTLGKRVKEAYGWLESEGLVPDGTTEKVSINSLRRGGNTAAAAEGIRRSIRQKHGRWKSEGMPDEYDDFAEGEGVAVSRALQARLNRR